MAKRLDDNQDFINTVLTEANWTQANIKVKLNENTSQTEVAPETTEATEKVEENDDNFVLSYDACPLCESELENDDAIFENIDTHFGNLMSIVEKAQAIQEGEDSDGELVVESITEEGCCPLCESAVEDDATIMANMNEHFDIVLEMLDELDKAEQIEEAKMKKPKGMPAPKMKPMPKKG